jgi:hypothetical protein
MRAQAKRKKRRPKPVTMADVDAFLASPVARHYFSFSESNIKRQAVRMLFYLRAEVDRLQRQVATQQGESPQWVQRVSGRTGS